MSDPKEGRPEYDYARLRRTLVAFFRWGRCGVPEDLTQETLRRGLEKMDAGFEPDDRRGYFFGIAWTLLKECRRLRGRYEHIPVEEHLLPVSEPFGNAERMLYVQEVLARVPEPDRTILIRYHQGEREALEREFGLSRDALRTKVHRIRSRLLAELAGPRKRL